MAYLADDADISPLLKSVGAMGQEGGRDEFRLLVSWLEAQGYKQILDTRPQGRTLACEEQGSSASRATLRCEFAFHLLRSDEVGLGPFSGSYFDFTVRDGEIIRASTYWETAEFSPQLWEPFASWVSLAHPEDAAVMYVDETHSGARLTDESIRLWALHTGEYAGSGRSYIARADAICRAAHQRVREEGGPEFYNESWGRILDEALTELRAVPPPEAVRARFDVYFTRSRERRGCRSAPSMGRGEICRLTAADVTTWSRGFVRDAPAVGSRGAHPPTARGPRRRVGPRQRLHPHWP